MTYTERDRRYFHCRLCYSLWRASKDGLAEYWQLHCQRRFKAGQEAYAITFYNGTVGYYHVECYDKLMELCSKPDTPTWVCRKFHEVRRYMRNRFEGLPKLLEEMRKSDVSNTEIVHKVMEAYACGQATAYRKIKALS